ncbi:hypothetical protein EMCRGX_G002623 [Ephydatia muelleri]
MDERLEPVDEREVEESQYIISGGDEEIVEQVKHELAVAAAIMTFAMALTRVIFSLPSMSFITLALWCVGSKARCVAVKLRDVFADICHKANLGVRIEAGSALTPDLSRSRPADALVNNWIGGSSAAFDVTVTSPLTPVSLQESSVTAGTAALLAEQRKHQANDPKCDTLGWKCIPLAVESYGNWGFEARQAFSHLASRLSFGIGHQKSKLLLDIYGRLNITLGSTSLQMFLSKYEYTPLFPRVTTAATPTSSTAATPTSSTAATPTSSTAATPTSSTAATPTSSTAATPTSSTAATPTSSTAATPTTSIEANPTSSTETTPTSSTAATPTSYNAATPTGSTLPFITSLRKTRYSHVALPSYT